ncbi:MAG: DUF2493 domain-containing protein [Clostridia bacterium]|nr:DUF2493 domain-containing protein [Clostridia bacterium]
MLRRVVVAGCRYYCNYEEAKEFIDRCISRIRMEYTLVFVSGCCRGADALGERYAQEHGFLIERHPAEWERFGRQAGPIRNRCMVQCSDFIICFWDGQSTGTASLIDYAREMSKPIRIKNISP